MDYPKKLSEFLDLLQSAQRNAIASRNGTPESIMVYPETGRKFDKILIRENGAQTVRYFVEKKTGTIYGAKSRFAPNKAWWLGTLERAHLWNWSEFHGRPDRDPEVRVAGSYGPYVRYLDVKSS